MYLFSYAARWNGSLVYLNKQVIMWHRGKCFTNDKQVFDFMWNFCGKGEEESFIVSLNLSEITLLFFHLPNDRHFQPFHYECFNSRLHFWIHLWTYLLHNFYEFGYQGLEFPKRIRIVKRRIRILFFQTILDIRIMDTCSNLIL